MANHVLPWKGERVTFKRYMEFCLYDPVHGYYASKENIFGPKGDYYTSPYTHPFFGQTLADAFARYFEELDRPERFDLIELGAGEGILGRDVMAHLEGCHPTVFTHTRYCGVEVGSPEWPPRIRGVVFSNEFFDALPVHRVRIRDSQPRELYVQVNDHLSEVEGELSDPRMVEYLKMGFKRLREGYEYEVNLRLREILEKLNRTIEVAIILTIDYGCDWDEYDSVPRAGGTLMCYHKHQALTDPYTNIGEQDMTSHVNFDVMRKIGTKLGWQNDPLQTQRSFLMEWGLEQRLLAEEGYGVLNVERLQERLRLKDLLLPGGISDTMKVLVQKVRV